MSGSTSMEKLANAVAESFMVKYPKVTVSAEFVDSRAGIRALQAGSVDIGNASRELKDDLTKKQLTKIYTEEITNWKDLGGEDAPIVVGREAGSYFLSRPFAML